jgi:transcriptional regulator with XRE-family HTH domain
MADITPQMFTRESLQSVLGSNLKEIRQRQGLSQEAFADVVGVHRAYMGGVERGERNLTLRSVERIAAALGIDPLTLLSPQPLGGGESA